MKKTLWILLLLTVADVFLFAQSNKFYSTDNSLSNSLICDIRQDSRGFIWIATEYGLNKFDGYKFTNYMHLQDDSLSLKDNYVQTIMEDRYGTLWVGCIKGLMKFDKAAERFERIDFYINGEKINPHIMGIVDSRSGQILVATSGYGIFAIDEKTGNTRQLNNLLSGGFISKIYEDANANLWITSSNYDLIERYNTLGGKTKIYRIAGNSSCGRITALTGNKEGFVFAGTSEKGLYIYNPHKDDFFHALSPEGQFVVSSLALKNEQELFVGTNGYGLKLYRLASNTIEDYPVDYAPFDLSSAKVVSLFRDKLDNLWLGVFQKGVVFISAAHKGFEYTGSKLGKNNPIGNNVVCSIYKDTNDVVWVGTDNEGIFAIDKQGRRMAHYAQTGAPNTSLNAVLSLFEDSNGDFWIGTYGNGLAKLNKKTGACEYVPELRKTNIYSISEDTNKNLLLGTMGTGLYLMDISGGPQVLRNFHVNKNHIPSLRIDELCNDYINSAICDKDGLIWIGHYEGLSCYNPAKNSFINYIKENNFIPGVVVMSLFEDYKGNIYAGTKNGLYYFNKQDTTLKVYTKKDGLSDNAICGITDDNAHNLWLSTFNGLNKFNVSTGEVINYYTGDGLQGNEFSRGAIFKDKDGTIYFGGIYGITYFSPEKISNNANKQDIFVTNFYLNNIPVRKGDRSGKCEIVDKAVIDADKFKLSYKDNSFSLDISTLDFIEPELIYYQYSIGSLKQNWTSLPYGMNRLTFNNLSHGEYELDIRAFYNGDYSAVRRISIVITPPWYQTWWAYCLYMLSGIALLYGIVNYIRLRMRSRREMLENEHAKAISEAKLQFFTNISHEIRTPMTLIITPLEKLINEHKDTPEWNIYLLIYRNAQRILRLVNQMMDMRKLDKGQMTLSCRETDMVGFIRDVMTTFEYPAHKRNIRFTFTHEAESLYVWVDLNNFDKVLMNLLSNAFKYTPDGGEINILLAGGKFSGNEGFFEIRISDTGIGIKEDDKEKIFNRFYQVDNDYSNYGTGIGLHLSRLLVELHKGVIYAENRTDTQGSCFVVKLPWGNTHLNESQKISLPAERFVVKNASEAVLSEPDKTVARKNAAKTRYHILVVDDDSDIREFLAHELSEEYHVHTCSNGKEGLEHALREKCDLIISDVMMPVLDGISLTKKIKSNINTNHIPVVLLSAKNTIQDKLDGLETEADAYFGKPFNIEILLQTINNLISVRKTLKNKYSGNEKQAHLVQPVEVKSADEILMEKLMRVVNEHLSDPELNVQDLSDTIGISRAHLYRKVKDLTNQSVQDFIRSIRLKQAADLLTSKKLSVSEVVYTTGFSSLSHFSNVFKDFYGMSPTEYVKNRIIE